RYPGLVGNSQSLLERGTRCPGIALLEEYRATRVGVSHACAGRRCVRVGRVDAPFGTCRLPLQLQGIAERQQRVEYDDLVVLGQRGGIDRMLAQALVLLAVGLRLARQNS